MSDYTSSALAQAIGSGGDRFNAAHEALQSLTGQGNALDAIARPQPQLVQPLTPEPGTPAGPSLHSATSGGHNPMAFRTALQTLIADSNGGLGVQGNAWGFRTREEQTKLYQQYLAGQGNLAAKPGHSMHEFGLAADLKFNSPAAQAWAHANAARYGLYFPLGGEPWHVQPVGT